MSRTLTQRISDIEPDLLLVGIDLGLDENVAVVIDRGARRVDQFTFPHSRGAYDYFYSRLQRSCKREGYSGIMVALEPTNYFWKLLAADLERKGIPYRLVNAYTVKKHREGNQLDRAKDDWRDAFTIADLLRTGKFTETQMLHGVFAEMRYYALLSRQLEKELRRQKTLLRQAVGQIFPELSRVFKSLTGQTARALLQRHAAATTLRQLNESDFIARVRQDYDGQRLEVTKLRKVHCLAQQSVGLVDVEAIQMAVRVHLQLVARLQQELVAVEDSLIASFVSLPEAPYLLSFKLGLLTTAKTVAEIGNPDRFRSGKQLVKLAGLQPSPNRSGRKRTSSTPMSGKGRAHLRTLLYFAAMRLIQHDDGFARQYQKLRYRSQNPLNGQQALVALSNKILHIFWALWSQRSFYDPASRIAKH